MNITYWFIIRETAETIKPSLNKINNVAVKYNLQKPVLVCQFADAERLFQVGRRTYSPPWLQLSPVKIVPTTTYSDKQQIKHCIANNTI